MRSLGSVESAADLPFDGCQEGDLCYVRNIEHHWIWDGRIWQDLGTTEDLVNARHDRLGLEGREK